MSDHEEALRALEEDLRARGRAADTLYQFGNTARAFLAFAGKPVAEIVTEDVRRFLAAGAQRGRSAVSQRATLVHLRALFRALIEANLIKENATRGMSVKRAPRQPQLFLSSDSMEKLLRAASTVKRPGWLGPKLDLALGLRTRALIELLYGTSVRACEVGRVLVADLDLQGGALTVRAAKRGESRTLPLPKAVLPHLEAYVREGRPLLLHPDGRDRGHLLLSRNGKPLDADNIYAIIVMLSKRAGIKTTTHAFRRSSATDMVRAGINLEAVRQILGHERLSTTAIYLYVSREDLRKAVEKLETSA